ncbi:MAG: hypothetical protein HY810_09815 [Candidatus Omnitrophica bacterium]|nr:hypothetical protein [Candidatus Omnitrophota bacterium]
MNSMNTLIIGCYFVVGIGLFLWPFYQRFKAKRVALSCVGHKIADRYVANMIGQKILNFFHKIKCEADIVLFLNMGNECINVLVKFRRGEGFLLKEVCKKVDTLKAKKVIVYRHHAQEISDPTQRDLRDIATLYSQLPNGVELLSAIVLCKGFAKSILENYRYLKMIQGI